MFEIPFLKITYTKPPEQSVWVEKFFTICDKRWKHLNLLCIPWEKVLSFFYFFAPKRLHNLIINKNYSLSLMAIKYGTIKYTVHKKTP